MKISVIIPAYNAEAYLGGCLESILAQTVQDIEIIVIDDGSTDRTKDILEEYRKKNEQIRVITKENEGQGIARNVGMEAATGEYLFFADADDTLPKNALSMLSLQLKKEEYDIVCGTYVRINEDGERQRLSIPCGTGTVAKNGNLSERSRYHAIKTKSVFGYVWGKLYRKEFLIKHEIIFDDVRTILLEDTLFNLKAFCKEPRYFFLNVPVYEYYERPFSYTSKKDEQLVGKMLRMLLLYKEYLEKNNAYHVNLDLFLPLLLRGMSWVVEKRCAYHGNSFDLIYETIKAFGEEKELRKAIIDKKALQRTLQIRNVPERLFFTFCLGGLRSRSYNTVTLAFYLMHPVSKWYIRRCVR